MDILEKVLVFVHFVGLASLLGGFLVQIPNSEKVVNNAMFHGVLTQVVTGVALVGVLEAMAEPDEPVNNAKVAAKLGVVLVILVLVLLNRKKPSISTGLWATIGGLTVLNIAIAVFW